MAAKSAQPKTTHLINGSDTRFLMSENGPRQATWCRERAFIDTTYTENGIEHVTCATCLRRYHRANAGIPAAPRKSRRTPGEKCPACRVPEHDTCANPLDPDCRCCADTALKMAEERG